MNFDNKLILFVFYHILIAIGYWRGKKGIFSVFNSDSEVHNNIYETQSQSTKGIIAYLCLFQSPTRKKMYQNHIKIDAK